MNLWRTDKELQWSEGKGGRMNAEETGEPQQEREGDDLVLNVEEMLSRLDCINVSILNRLLSILTHRPLPSAP
jgi:hypothetical protein